MPPDPAEDDALLTPPEVSGLLRKPIGTLTDWRYRGCGPEYVRMGRSIYYRRSAIERWIEAHTIRPGAA